jgi:hypothetical protein
MDRQLVTFTALPNGIASNGRLRLSVFVSPFLQPDGGGAVTLDRFPDWLDWPSRSITFQAQFGTAAPVAATRVGEAPRPDLWTRLFSGGAQVAQAVTKVEAAGLAAQATSDGTRSLFHTYDTRFLHSWLKEAYVGVAIASPEEFPKATDLRESGPIADLASTLQDEWNAAREAEEEDHEGEGDGGGGGVIRIAASDEAEEVRRAFDDLRRFHKPFVGSLAKVPETRPDPATLRFDVHQVITALSRYPVLARMLGLVHDLEVPHPGNLGETTVQVLASWTPVSGSVETVVVPGPGGAPRLATRCKVSTSPSAFHALPREAGAELAADGSRMIPLDDPDRYEVVQIDHDGAAIRSFNFAQQLVRHHSTADEGTPDGYALPALSSVGFAVARVGRGSAVTAAMADGAAKNRAVLEGTDVTLDAEDVTRGYAIDVWDDASRKWRSLCERVGDYAFSAAGKAITLTGIADEGWVSTSAARPVDDTAEDVAPRLPETLFQWYGWSLAASRPGKYVDLDGNVSAVGNRPGPDWPFAVTFRPAPGSLPRLRFGTTYSLRARVVDLAGNRDSRADADASHATRKAVYGRFDPIVSPEIVPQQPLTEGESAQRMVIRSNFNSAMIAATGRHAFPPKAAEPMVEAHGVFDKSTGVIDTSGYGTIQSRDGVTFDKVGKADPNVPGAYYVDGTSATTPYLPDLLSRGALLRGLPGATGPTRVSFGYTEGVKWPNPTPFLIRLVEGSGPPTFDKGNRLLTVKLPKADVATARLSSYLVSDQGDVNRLGLVQWLDEAGVDADTMKAFRQAAADGRHWMVTPWRDLTFVHAVRQPLLRPRYRSLTPTRKLGDTFVELSDDQLEVSRKSTVTVDVVARWTEMIDPPSEPGPRQATGNARPFQVQVPLASDPDTETTLAIKGRHEFADRKYRRISYSAIATSRFAEYFAQRRRGLVLTSAPFLVNGPVTDDGENLGGVVAGSESVTASDRSRTFQRGTDYTMDYLAGTITALGGLIGQRVDIAFTAPPITRKAAAPVVLDIKNAARPDAPKVLYAIPTFGWSSSVNSGSTLIQSTRRGRGLRVYLDRPWFSSGDGERLGVVIWAGASAPSPAAKAVTTEWGLDPVFLSGATTSGPTIGAFSLADATQTSGLTVEELPPDDDGQPIHVAGHKVEYDAERRLWYADLEIDAGATYFPFVRLALARYQPISVPNAHLSRVVRADFVQLAPDRAVTITRPKGNARDLAITVAGVGYTRAAGADGRSRIEVSLERKRATTDLAMAQELGWEEVPNSGVALTASGPAGTTAWTGAITLPAGSAGAFRVIVREIELYGSDRRAVYADAIVI